MNTAWCPLTNRRGPAVRAFLYQLVSRLRIPIRPSSYDELEVLSRGHFRNLQQVPHPATAGRKRPGGSGSASRLGIEQEPGQRNTNHVIETTLAFFRTGRHSRADMVGNRENRERPCLRF